MPTALSPPLTFRVTSAPPVTGLPNAPAWAQSYVKGEWNAFSLNQLKDVDPRDDAAANPNGAGNTPPWAGGSFTNNDGVIRAWNGGALATPGTYSTHGAMILHGGGHSDYAGNEVYQLDLGSRLFSRLKNPYPTPDKGVYYPGASPYPNAVYPDGSPLVPHTYADQGYDPVNGRYWQLRGVREAGSSTPSNNIDLPNAHGFSLTAKTWIRTPLAQRTNGAAPIHSGAKACYDSKRACFWVIPPGVSGNTDNRFDLLKLSNLNTSNGDGTYGTWTRYPFYTPGDIESCLHYEPVDDLLIFDDWRQSQKRIYVYELSKLGVSDQPVAITQAGTIPPIQSAAGGWDWSPGLNALVYLPYNAGATLYKCVKPATAWQTNAWQWSVLTAGTNTQAVPAGLSTTTIYTRLRVARFADMELSVVVTRRDAPAYAMRIY